MWAPFAELFHIHPADIDRLTYPQFCALEQRVYQRMRAQGGVSDDG